jgi:hypothetical protein
MTVLAVRQPTVAGPDPRTGRPAVPVAVVLALSSLGVLLVAVGYAVGRSAGGHGMTWYWTGQALVFVPVLARVLAGRLRESEAFALVIGLAVNGYALKWAYSPDRLRFGDELQHWYATETLVRTGHLYAPNPSLPPAVHYPGLAEIGASLAGMTGLPVTAAAFIVAGALHLVYVGAIFMLVRRCGAGPTTAALTCVIYATGLHYLFFDSMYVYQTAALPFLILVLWAVRRRRGAGVLVVGAVAVLAVTFTHHVTGIVLVLALGLLAVLDRRRSTVLAAVFAAGCVGGWMLLVAPETLSYLGQPIAAVARAADSWVHGAAPAGGPSGGSSPWVLALQGAGIAGLGVVLLFGTRAAARVRTRDPWLIATLIGAVAFFAGGALRALSSAGPELGARAATFTYLPMAAVAAAVLLGRNARVAGFVLVLVLVVGARLGGWPPPSALLPSAYAPAAQERSVDPLGVAAATWSARHLGTGSRVAADLGGGTLVSTYGRQDPVDDVAGLYDSPTWTDADGQLIDEMAITGVWVDTRLATMVSPTATLFLDDPRAGLRTRPLTAAQIDKFDSTPGLSRVFDNGAIRIYQVSDLP